MEIKITRNTQKKLLGTPGFRKTRCSGVFTNFKILYTVKINLVC